ncbi:hypothetical protein [Numidum massiliense]|uniref:hypothetical protein n=1 Tax=Numidum massiliense TaxID=1522315 RepID=UPI0006D56178|nr:hypothetical protein [Numidum massiliense]
MVKKTTSHAKLRQLIRKMIVEELDKVLRSHDPRHVSESSGGINLDPRFSTGHYMRESVPFPKDHVPFPHSERPRRSSRRPHRSAGKKRPERHRELPQHPHISSPKPFESKPFTSLPHMSPWGAGGWGPGLQGNEIQPPIGSQPYFNSLQPYPQQHPEENNK